jgi:hypothetical protein
MFRTRQVKKTTGPVVVRLAEMATKREREDTPVLVSLKKVSPRRSTRGPEVGLIVSVLIVRSRGRFARFASGDGEEEV